jgi:hypothetical protein
VDPDELTPAHRAALEEVERLRAEVVRLHARVQVLVEAEATRSGVLPRRRGLASLINNAGARAG